MEISTRHYGGHSGKAYAIIEITVQDGGNTMTVDVTDLYGKVDEELIQSFKDIVEELEEQNELINKAK